MHTRHPTHPDDLPTLTSPALRDRFLVEDLFAAGEVRLAYSHHDRLVVGARDVLYVGRGTGEVTFEGAGARFYLVSAPAHADGIASGQLVLGITELAEGSVWNTMPCHTHERRTEVYLYFGLGEAERVMHLCGRPDGTRSIIVANEQAVVSPPWSVHCGAGTASYSFVWAMAGENVAYDDLEVVANGDLR
ncbi:MAG TPA: 5-deoxy-glucuronate isomerase [Planosporangium sp.]|nr:5-deoxy-glucuronate isomerase [Planosporangium sp.]